MYVEKQRVIIKNSSNTMSSSDVNEATAALKGMLGIGSSSNTPSKKSVTVTVASPVCEEPSSKAKAGQSSKKKKKNQRPKKTKQKARVPSKEDKPSPQTQTTSTEGSENFAWSAFQASPDASSLPIPAFSPAITEPEPTVDVSASTTSVPVTEERSDIADDTTRTRDAVVEEKTVDEPPVQEEEQEEEALVSNTGINLAALTASPPSHTATNPTPRHTALSQAAAYEQPVHHHHAPHYPQPPHFMTIQVQVPPVLMPGRQMVVASPMGYPVQVTVPEGVPPGMVIPVHVPAYGHPGPHMMPGTRPPPHMMPPGPAPPPHMMPGPATAPHMRPYPPHGYHPHSS
jgi:hypothetical protein